MEKILLISPFPKNNVLYPHLQDFITLIEQRFDVEYFYFTERGYWIKSVLNKIKLYNPFSYKPIYSLLKNFLRLYKRRKGKYYAVIAIDTFPYTVAGTILKNTNLIFWSHDFISMDNLDIEYWINKFILKKCKNLIEKNRKIIIQDNLRLRCLLQTTNNKEKEVDVFYMPVSLKHIYAPKGIFFTKPVIMQIGGINIYRSNSNLLIDHFKLNHYKYTLFLHGFIDEKVLKLIEEAPIRPIVSSTIANPESIPKIIGMCDMGFISYNGGDINFQNIANASGQLAEFLRLGKPIIHFGETNIKNLIQKENIGISIDNFVDFNNAFDQIISNYEYYSDNCKNLFESNYCIEKYFPEIINFISNE